MKIVSPVVEFISDRQRRWSAKSWRNADSKTQKDIACVLLSRTQVMSYINLSAVISL